MSEILTPNTPNTATILAWNVQSGGYNDYIPEAEIAANRDARPPERAPQIRNFVRQQQAEHGVDTAVFTDAYAWDVVYRSEAWMAHSYGFAEARFTRLGDERLADLGRPGVGIAIATNHKIAETEVLELWSRNALSVTLDIGEHGLKLVGVYDDDMDELVRLENMRRLTGELKEDVPTMLVGDFNTLRPDMRGTTLSVKGRDLLVRAAARVLPEDSPLGQSVRSMNERQVVPFLESQGFTDADAAEKRPTSPAALPAFGIDYAFYNKHVTVSDMDVINPRGASDHYALRVQANV